jgi:hypothetical protein
LGAVVALLVEQLAEPVEAMGMRCEPEVLAEQRR